MRAQNIGYPVTSTASNKLGGKASKTRTDIVLTQYFTTPHYDVLGTLWMLTSIINGDRARPCPGIFTDDFRKTKFVRSILKYGTHLVPLNESYGKQNYVFEDRYSISSALRSGQQPWQLCHSQLFFGCCCFFLFFLFLSFFLIHSPKVSTPSVRGVEPLNPCTAHSSQMARTPYS